MHGVNPMPAPIELLTWSLQAWLAGLTAIIAYGLLTGRIIVRGILSESPSRRESVTADRVQLLALSSAAAITYFMMGLDQVGADRLPEVPAGPSRPLAQASSSTSSPNCCAPSPWRFAMSPESIEAISWSFVAFLIILEFLALWAVFQLLNKGMLAGLLIESDGSKASLARLQALIFTFVVAGLFMIFSLDIGDFVEIPETVLGLLGISGGTFLISKGIGSKDSEPEAEEDPSPDDDGGQKGKPAPGARGEGGGETIATQRRRALMRSPLRRTWRV